MSALPLQADLGIPEAAFLGAVQGLTEFLPVSSSGHLALAGHWLGTRQPGIAFELLLHVATLLAVLVHYRRDVFAVSLFWLRDIWTRADRFRDERWHLSLAILTGTAVTMAIVFPLEDRFESLFDRPRMVGALLIVTAALLLSTLLRRTGEIVADRIPLWMAAVIGAAQGLAAMPGISRSGSTIAVALLLGVARPEAARLSFLLSIPVILGAAVLKVPDLQGGGLGAAPLGVGFVTAAAVGYLALISLVALVARGRLVWFAPYCAAFGLAAILFT